MQPSEPNPPSSSADAPTLDAQAVDSPLPQPCAKVQLVEGTGPGLSTQTQSLLRVRLRAAALVLALGSGAFLVWGFFGREMDLMDHRFLMAGEKLLFRCHVAHVASLAIIAVFLCQRCPISIRTLRYAELGIFGLTAAFFFVVQQFNTLYCVYCLHSVPSPVGLWYALIFTYAIFIPNTWRRAAVIIGCMAAAPIVALVVQQLRFEPVAELVRQYDQLPTVSLMMLVGFGSSVYGTYMMNNLRQEAYEARQLGQYRLRHRIGAGGMGEVYLAEHQLLKRPCAIKLIRPDKAADSRTLARFEREVRITATLSHWNTVDVFDYGHTDDGTFYYVMEYLPGLSLAQLVEQYGPLPPERVIYLLKQVCDALREAHAVGLVHRDVKPSNIFAAQRGGVYDVAKLLDFGLVKPPDEPQALHLTQEGAITGSPLFLSPEQALGESEPDARSDVYSLGAVAYYTLTGRPPFEGDKPLKVLFAHAHEAVVPLTQLRPDIPADLEQVVLRCLAKRPEDRYQSAESLAQALGACHSADRWSRQQAADWWQQVAESATAVAAG